MALKVLNSKLKPVKLKQVSVKELTPGLVEDVVKPPAPKEDVLPAKEVRGISPRFPIKFISREKLVVPMPELLLIDININSVFCSLSDTSKRSELLNMKLKLRLSLTVNSWFSMSSWPQKFGSNWPAFRVTISL